MPNTGASIVAAGADDASVGTVAWTTPGNITADDASYAQIANGGISVISHYLKGTNPAGGSPGFSVPAGAAINGIVVEWKRKVSTTITATTDSSVKLVIGGTIQGNNNSAGAAWSTTEGWASFGSSSDLWGLTPTAAQVNASDFGAVLSASIGAGVTAAVNACRITVYYTAAGGLFMQSQMVGLGAGGPFFQSPI